ncbi:MAG: DUF309 domain-containing protein [Candidatus Aminicenantes bacterium]|jgi:hypothetical protein
MTERQGTPMLTPTYNTVLIMAIQDVIRALNAADYLHAHDCLETLWNIAPPKVEEELAQDWQNYQNKLNAVNNVKGIDAVDSIHLQSKAAKQVLIREVRPMLQKIKKSLHDHKYLESEYGAKPKYEKRGKLTVPK